MEISKKIRIRRSREEKLKEQAEIKKVLRDQLPDKGDIKHIWEVMNEGEDKSISYNAVAYTLNPKNQYWSPRVIQFVKAYLAERDAQRQPDLQVH